MDQSNFFALTPDKVLEAVEQSGLQCTGRCLTLNSFENRVYEVELEDESHSRKIVKFYRPGRWTPAQILEEHQFLADLVQDEIPVIEPLKFPNGQTLHEIPSCGILFALFPKVGGRAPDELSDEQLVRLGRLLGRIHNVGARRKSPNRILIGPETYGVQNLQFLKEKGFLPPEFERRYSECVSEICERTLPWFKEAAVLRLHGDCHRGNLLWNDRGPFFLDFDDMVQGPDVQDFWLLCAGEETESLRQRRLMIEGYSEFRQFDSKNLRLIEPLRALRVVHYAAWIARRWDDPIFPLTFPDFNTHTYWNQEVLDLEKALHRIKEGT